MHDGGYNEWGFTNTCPCLSLSSQINGGMADYSVQGVGAAVAPTVSMLVWKGWSVQVDVFGWV